MVSCRTEVYKLVEDLHSVGIVHKDLEPRNILRVEGGGFRLVDFSESRKHTCKEKMVPFIFISAPIDLTLEQVSERHGQDQVRNRTCAELQALRSRLWPTLSQ